MLNSEERGNYQLIKSVGCLTEFLHTDDFLGVTFLLLVAQKATQQVCQTAFFLERSALCKWCTHACTHGYYMNGMKYNAIIPRCRSHSCRETQRKNAAVWL